VSALHAPLKDPVAQPLLPAVDRDGLHEAEAGRRTVARVDIHVLAVEALCAVVGDAVPLHQVPALPAVKVLDEALEVLVEADGRTGRGGRIG
jgi:hypothetical protein